MADLLATAHREGHAWVDMAILCRHTSAGHLRRESRLTLRKHKLPLPLRQNSSSVFDPAHDSIKVMTLHVSKGLEFPVVILNRVMRHRLKASGHSASPETALAQLRRIQRQSVSINQCVSITGISTVNRDQADLLAAMNLRKPAPDFQISLL